MQHGRRQFKSSHTRSARRARIALLCAGTFACGLSLASAAPDPTGVPAPPSATNPASPTVAGGNENATPASPPPGDNKGDAPAAGTNPGTPAPPPLGGLDVPAAAPAGDTAPNVSGRIARISIRGNVNITTDAIRAVLRQKVGSPYTPAAADRDRASIKGMGYFNGDVGLNVVPNGAGGVDETYTVTENPVIKKIVFTANTPSGQPSIPSDKLKTLPPPYAIQTREGQVLNTNTLVSDIDKLFNHQNGYMARQGFIADVSSDINIDPNSGTLTIPLVEAVIQDIRVKGNRRTKTVVITRELRSKAGDVLNQNQLQRELTRVYNLGLFDTVGPIDLEPTDVGKVAITIPVTEKRSGQVTVGVGYSSRSKLVGRAELAENNFRGLGERVSVQAEVGGISSASSLEVGFFEPYLDRRHTSLNVDVYNKVVYRFSNGVYDTSTTSGDSSNYTETRRGGSLSVDRPISFTSSVGLSVRAENVTTNNVDTPASGSFIRQDGSVAAVGLGFTSNTRDNDLAPAGGGYRSFTYELGTSNTSTVGNAASPLAPGRHGIGKFGMDARQYISLQGPRALGNITQPKRVLALRLLLGFSNRDLPFFEQYFLGGADSLRGAQTDRYWGNNLALFQSELRVPIGKGSNLQGVLLADFGDAWGSLYQAQGLAQHRSLSISGDYGFGIRLVTPIGPIRVDYAIPTNGGGSGRTQFSIGQSF